MHTFDRPCSRRCVDDVYWLFWKSPTAVGDDFAPNLTDGEQALALCNDGFKQSLFVSSRASLEQAVGRRRVLAVLEVPGRSGGRFFSKSQRWGTTAGPMQSSL
jgi:hypothetical protein